MMVYYKRLVSLIAITACLLAVGVAPAQAWVLWASSHGIKSGESVLGPNVELIENLTEPLGSGIICAGISGYGSFCPSEAVSVDYQLGNVVKSEPYAHDHSSFTSGFNAWYEG
jgi:hypothetical protein